MADNNFEQNVKDRMENFNIHPSVQVWQQVEEQLQKDKRKRRWFFIWLPIIVLVAGGGMYMLTLQTGNENPVAHNQFITENNTAQSSMAESKPLQQVIEQQQTEQPIQTKEEKQQQFAVKTKQSIKINQEAQQQQIQSKQQPVQLAKLLNSKTVNEKPVIVSEKRTDAQVLLPTATTKQKKKNLSNDKLSNTINKDDNRNEVAVDMPCKKEQEDVIVKITMDEKLNYIIVVPADSTKQTEPNSTVQTNNNDTTNNAVANPEKPAVSVPVIEKPNNKWQIGSQVNAGIADIGAAPLPFVSSKRENAAYAIGGPIPITGSAQSRVTESYNYEIKSNLQFGGGLLLRKKFAKKLSFITGLQYQYSSFTAIEKFKRDSVWIPTNAAFNIFDRQTETNFKTHYINVPTELQWQVFKRKTGSLNLSAGLQHFIRISKKDLDSIPGFISQRTSAGLSIKQPVVSLYQPMLHVAPSYEWQKNKNNFSLGWYFNYGLLKVYNADGNYHWRQTGLTFRYFFPAK